MRVLFCHDGPLRKDENNNYYGTAHNDSTFSRYYSIADELAVAIRVVDIFANEAENKLSRITVTPFEVIECSNLSSLKGILFKKKNVDLIIKKEVMKSNYIVIRLPSVIGKIALKYAKNLNKPYLVEVVACHWDSLWNHSIKGKILAPFSFYRTKKLIKDADAVMYITEKFLQRRYPTNGKKYISPNVALKHTNQLIIMNREKHIDSIINRKKVIVTSIGATNMKYKGHEFMIKALRLLIDTGYSVEYHIIGGGDRTRLLELSKRLKIEKSVIFHGALPHNEIFNYLDKTDIYIQPSLAEAQGRSLIEAMSRGCPCICTNVGGMPELIEDKFIVKKRDPEELANKVRLILNSNMKEVATRNFEFAKKFDSEVINSERIEIYSEVFNNCNKVEESI